MFETGRYYSITTASDGDFITTTGHILEWSPPLLKYESGSKTVILNTSSPVFFKAEPGYSPEEIEEADRRLMTDIDGG